MVGRSWLGVSCIPAVSLHSPTAFAQLAVGMGWGGGVWMPEHTSCWLPPDTQFGMEEPQTPQQQLDGFLESANLIIVGRDGKEVRAHRDILIVASPVLKDLIPLCPPDGAGKITLRVSEI